MEMKSLGRYKIFGVVTNKTLPGEELIHWHRLCAAKANTLIPS